MPALSSLAARLSGATLWLCCLLAHAAAAPAPDTLVYARAESSNDSRYDYDWAVLRMALDKTRASFGPYTLQPSDQPMSPARVLAELRNRQRGINILVRATSTELERTLLPIRFPVDRGLLGYRLFLARPADLPRLAAVRTVEDLRAFSIGQGYGWSDNGVLRAAGFTVLEGTNYEGLFDMLRSGRFDLFSRAPDEALAEFDQRRHRPGLAVEPTLLLQYPLARYFFVRRDAEGERLARRITAGLESMLKDGSLLTLFYQYKGPLLQRANLSHRRILHIPNPDLPPLTPLERRELWYQPGADK